MRGQSLRAEPPCRAPRWPSARGGGGGGRATGCRRRRPTEGQPEPPAAAASANRAPSSSLPGGWVGGRAAAMGALPRTALLWLLAAAGGLAFLALLFLDWKRRSAPDFAQRLREKRKKEHEKTEDHDTKFLELKDSAGVQEYFLRELQLGERCLERGHHKKSIEHLTNAIAVCTEPSQLMEVYEQTLPPQVFEMLARRIQYVTEVGAFKIRVGNNILGNQQGIQMQRLSICGLYKPLLDLCYTKVSLADVATAAVETGSPSCTVQSTLALLHTDYSLLPNEVGQEVLLWQPALHSAEYGIPEIS
ncbi:hypothetical protein lerEdw1_001703 [Lerista edwardsae]|nr:hypothetical protein lerEdw1_001703 [Lerista edwardsae]